jgi:hypothetical protein
MQLILQRQEAMSKGNNRRRNNCIFSKGKKKYYFNYSSLKQVNNLKTILAGIFLG